MIFYNMERKKKEIDNCQKGILNMLKIIGFEIMLIEINYKL